ncbi:MAG: CoA transferase [Xanthobacteraceae bacterium]|jgi:crotonobetainyl-CoA:carnitine CoA-transferase CaiB-like acyl-CoA transferase
MSSAKPSQKTQAPLQGLRVLDLTSMIAGPHAAQILADYGADVIKIEPPEGDLMRKGVGAARSADMGPLYLQLNRNKRSVVLDVKQPAARKALLQLCERADVFITNTRPAAMRRLKLAYDDVRKVNPRLVYVSLMGYGDTGPYAGKPAYDDLIQGICALPTIVAQTGGEGPRYVPLTVVDRIVGINAAHVILAAVLGRDRTGEGQSVELPMFETMAQFVLGDHLGGRSFDPPIGEAGNPRLMSETRRPYATRDGHVCALVYTNKQWKAFFEGLGRLDQYAANPHLHDFASRRRHVNEVNGIIADFLRTLTTAEALALFERCDIPCAPMNDLDALIDDPHLAAVEFFQTRPHPTEGRIRYNGIPSRWNGAALKITRHAPRLGEHSLAVLKEAGISAEEIAALLASGATIDGAVMAQVDASAPTPIAPNSAMS